MSMTIDGLSLIARVEASRIANEARSWGLARAVAIEIVSDVIDRAPAAIEAALADTPGPASVLGRLEARLAKLRVANP
jgi:hypothetical protein